MTLRVLHLIPSIASRHGGPSRSVPNLCRALQEAGATVELFAYAEPGPRAPELARASMAGVGVTELPWLPLVRATPAALRRADVVHVHSIWSPYLHTMIPLARALGRPVVISPRGMLEPNTLARKSWKKRIALKLAVARDLRHADLLHATGALEAGQFQRLGFGARIAIIPNGVDLPPESLPAREDGASPYVLYLGRLHPHKGLPELLEACARVRDSLTAQGLTLRLVGPDVPPHAKALRTLIADRSLQDLVRLEGPAEGDHKWRLLRDAEWLVLPSHSENFGMSVAEALACGTPALTTTTTPWSALASEGCGLQVAPTVDGLELGMRDMLARTPPARRQMGARGRAFMQAEFAWAPIARAFLRAYEETLATRSR